MLRLKILTRWRTKATLYFDICREYSQEYKECFDEVLDLSDNESWERLGKDKEHILYYTFRIKDKEKLWAKAVTFGAMCLEAFIYDYAAHNLSDTYTRKYLDKLDLISKWVIIPRLVTGKILPRESQAFEHLKRLVKERNELVHPKSSVLPPVSLKDIENRKIFDVYFRPGIEKDIERDKYGLNPYETVVEVLTKLQKLERDETGTRWWQLKEVDPEQRWECL